MNANWWKRYFGVIFLSILSAAAAYVYVYHFVVIEKISNAGYSEEANKNPYLALGLFLQKKDVDFQYSRRVTLLDKMDFSGSDAEHERIRTDDTVVLVNASGTLSGRRYDSVMEWVDAGGVLITTMRNPFLGEDLDDDLSALFDVKAISSSEYYEWVGDDVDDKEGKIIDELLDDLVSDNEKESDENGEGDERQEDVSEEAVVSTETLNSNIQANDQKDSVEEGAEINQEGQEHRVIDNFEYSDLHACDVNSESLIMPNRMHRANVDLSSGGYFKVDGDPDWVAAKDGQAYRDVPFGVGFYYGNGVVYFLRDVEQWRNQVVQCHDHAYFFSQLMNPYSSKVWVIENRDAPSLLSLFVRYFPAGAFGLALVIGLLLWHAFVRFGPVFNYSDFSRRRFFEHVKADALFVWRYGGFVRLLEPQRAQVERRLAQKIFAYENKSPREKLAAIKQIVGIEEKDLNTALFAEEIENVNVFIGATKVLKKLKDEL